VEGAGVNGGRGDEGWRDAGRRGGGMMGKDGGGGMEMGQRDGGVVHEHTQVMNYSLAPSFRIFRNTHQ
jgi:hypothetical protein